MKSRAYALCLALGASAVLAFILLRHPTKEPVESAADSRPAISSPLPLAGPSAMPPGQSPAPAPIGPATMPTPLSPTGPTAPAVTTTGAPANVPMPPLQGVDGPAAAPNQAAQIDVGRVRHMISDFHTLTGENPVGTNAEIMKQMMGGNARQATLGPPDGIPLNGQGELMDQWGTPYFFHQLSKDKMEVRSAGPDKVMWTADDVITR